MFRSLSIVLVLVGCLMPARLDARGPWQRRVAARHGVWQQPVYGQVFQQPLPASSHTAWSRIGVPSAAYWRSQYPQYYGGFHARHLQNIGIPTGDIGIRGNSITANPW